jgi:SAM-dependent methyltransferase
MPQATPTEHHRLIDPASSQWIGDRPARGSARQTREVPARQSRTGIGIPTITIRVHGATTCSYPRLMSWDERFSYRYDDWSAGMTADVPFYVGLASETVGPVVELAVGNGRVAIPVAQASNRCVIGIDSSPSMIEQARTKATAAGVDLDLRIGDMRDLELEEPADLIYCPFRALLHLPTWADRRRVFERVSRSLRPGGRFAWNAFAFDHHIAACLDGEHQDSPVPHTNRYDVADNRIDIVLDDGGVSSIWWATKNEWLGLIDVAGLEVEALYGDFDGTPLSADSREYIFVATHQ